MLRDKNERRIVAMHCGPEQAGRILRRAWDGDVNAGKMRKSGLVRLAVPQAAARQISAIRRVDHDGTGPAAERAPAQSGKVRDELVPGGPDEVNELQLKHRPLAVGGETARHAHDGGFGERRVVNLLRKLSREFLREAEYAAFRILNVFTENDPIRVSLESEAERLIDRVPDPVFAWRKNFVIELGELSGDLNFQLVRRRIFRPLRFREFLPDPFLDLFV